MCVCCDWICYTGQSWSRRKWTVSIWRDAVRHWQRRIGGCRRNCKNWGRWKRHSHSTCSFQLPLSPCVPLVNGSLPTTPPAPQPEPTTPTVSKSQAQLLSCLLASPEYYHFLMARPKPIRWLHDPIPIISWTLFFFFLSFFGLSHIRYYYII